MPEAWSTAVSAVTSGMGDVVTTITGSAVMLVMVVGVPFVGACIGLAKRLFRSGGRRR